VIIYKRFQFYINGFKDPQYSPILLKLLVVVAILIGQIIKKYVEDKRVFYIIHLVFIVTITIVSVSIASNQSGGVSWPWWFFAILYSIPILVPLGIGVYQDLTLNKINK
jgi:hypothetical protein